MSNSTFFAPQATSIYLASSPSLLVASVDLLTLQFYIIGFFSASVLGQADKPWETAPPGKNARLCIDYVFKQRYY
jgi:hypothetical protein